MKTIWRILGAALSVVIFTLPRWLALLVSVQVCVTPAWSQERPGGGTGGSGVSAATSPLSITGGNTVRLTPGGTLPGMNGSAITNVVAQSALMLSNQVNPVAYGAIGDGVTSDDTAFSNAWNVVKSSGGTFDYSSRGKTFVLNNFTFLQPDGAVDGKCAIRGAGSRISYTGTNWCMIFTNVIPWMDDIYITGTAAGKGGLFITGTPSSRKLRNLVFNGFTTGYGFMGEAMENFEISGEAVNCRYGATIARYCDWLTLDFRAQGCVIGVQTARTNEHPWLVWAYGAPIGGTWKISGLFNGDLAVVIAKGVQLNVSGESATNTFLSFGHNLARHGALDNNASAAYSAVVDARVGFGNNFGTNAVVEVNNIGIQLDGELEVYSSNHTNMIALNDVTSFEGSSVRVKSFSQSLLASPLSFYDGSRVTPTFGNFPTDLRFNELGQDFHRALNSINTTVSSRAVREIGTIDFANALPALRAGYWDSGFAFKTFLGGLTLDRVSSGSFRAHLTNAWLDMPTGNLQMLSGHVILTNGNLRLQSGNLTMLGGNIDVGSAGWISATNFIKTYTAFYYGYQDNLARSARIEATGNQALRLFDSGTSGSVPLLTVDTADSVRLEMPTDWGTAKLGQSNPWKVYGKDSVLTGATSHTTNTYSGSIAVVPGNTVTPVGWMPLTNAGTRYYVPLYQ
jgi:hypothetical protein